MEYLAHTLNLALFFVALTVSLNLILGFGGMVSMSHAVFFCVGGYISTLITMKLGCNFLVGMAAATLATGLAGGVLAGPFIKIKDEYLILFTLSFQMISYHLMLSLISITGGDSGIFGVPSVSLAGWTPETPLGFLPLTLLFVVAVYYVAMRLTQSPFGRVLKGLREDDSAVASLGKNVLKFKVIVFMVGTGLAAAAGALFAHYSRFINPTIGSLDESILLIAMVALGGVANLWGSAVGAFLLIVIPELLTFIPGASDLIVPLRNFIYGLLLLLFMRFRPEGIIPEYFGHARSRRLQRRLTEARTAQELRGEEQPPAASAAVDDGVVLEVQGLAKSFGGIQAVSDFSLTLRRGMVTALVGPNGCGKTTAFNLITGFLRPDQGRVILLGRDITSLKPHQRTRAGLVRSWQDVRIFQDMTVLDNVLLARQSQKGENPITLLLLPWLASRQRAWHRQKAYGYLGQVGLADKAGVISRDLSYAEQKLLAIARLLSTEAPVLLFDEPSSGVDPNWVSQVMEITKGLARAGKTICIVEHNLEVVKGISDQVYFMAEGKGIAQGTAEELMADPRLGEIYFGV
ncbi:MAG: branched-chain amino acid ABC transporter ATP-binding protein/permease [Pseudomonadota bacterium]